MVKYNVSISDRQQLLAGARNKTGVFKPYLRLAGLRLQFRAAQQPRYWRVVR